MSAKKGSFHNRGGWLKDPRTSRPAEKIGGGFFVFRRGDGTGRIRPSLYPFEHPTLDAAVAMAEAHSISQPGYQFDVVGVLASRKIEAAPAHEVEAA